MGKGLMIFAGSMILAASWLFYSGTGMSSRATNEQLSTYGSQLMAKEIAKSGAEDAVLRLTLAYSSAGSYSGPVTWTGNYQGGSFRNEVTITGSNITILTTGTHDSLKYNIQRSYTAVIHTNPPPFMAAGITTDGNITFDHDLNLNSNVPGENANIHANGNINIQSGTSLIQGFGFRTGNTNISNGQLETDIFQPVSNPGGAAVTHVVGAITVPSVNATSHSSKATVPPHYGNLDLSGTITLGTEANPAIVFVDGNLTTSGDVTYSGYGVYLVTGNVDINHNFQSADSLGQNTFGLYSDDNIRLNSGNLEVTGHWFADGNITLKDQTIFNGSFTTTGNFTTGGRLTMNYIPISSSVTAPFWSGGSTTAQLDMMTSREWPEW